MRELLCNFTDAILDLPLLDRFKTPFHAYKSLSLTTSVQQGVSLQSMS